jgi:hypothetical protein
METTIELPEYLFTEAKATVARHRVPRRALIEHALSRETAPSPESNISAPFVVVPLGILQIKKRGCLVTFNRRVNPSVIAGGHAALHVLGLP